MCRHCLTPLLESLHVWDRKRGHRGLCFVMFTSTTFHMYYLKSLCWTWPCFSFYGKFCVSFKQQVFGGNFQSDSLSVLKIMIFFFLIKCVSVLSIWILKNGSFSVFLNIEWHYILSTSRIILWTRAV